MTALWNDVARWRPLVTEELARVSSPIPVGVVLAVIQLESAGEAGLKASRKAGDGSYAIGLMQCIQSAIDTYNAATGASVRYEWLGGESDESARYQVRVGIWLLGRAWANVREYVEEHEQATPALDQLVRLGDCAYAMGWGGLKAKLEDLTERGLPATYGSLESEFPTWGQPANNPLRHARTVWALYLSDSGQSVVTPSTPSKPELEVAKPPRLFLHKAGAAAALAAAVALVLWLLKGSK